jgi:dipeptidase D
MSDIKNLEPRALWGFFDELCAIPRPSKHEEKVIEYVLRFAGERNLFVEKDEAGNVLIRKPAAPGFEKIKPVVLQAHLDMVPQKNAEVSHDFLKDAICPVIDGEWVRASGTTLGADNGIGVAAALAVLDSAEVLHGPLEVLFTFDEESGMTGANNLRPDWLKGKMLLNLDTEEEGEFCIGCAGGLDFIANLPYSYDPMQGKYSTYRLNVRGLKGGHSGMDIHLGRANSNQLMIRFLWKITRDLGACVVELEGGNMRNAIPREASAIVNIPLRTEEAFLDLIPSFTEIISQEFKGVETGISFTAEKILPVEKVMDKVTETLLINALYALVNGPVRMIPGAGVVETSSNLSIVSVQDGMAEVVCLIRSAVESAKRSLGERMLSAFELIGADVSFEGNYPGWNPDFSSSLLEAMKKGYLDLFGKEAQVNIVHAGLECGIIGANYKEMEMISFGPTIVHPHSPDEGVEIASVVKFWNFLTSVLSRLPSEE